MLSDEEATTLYECEGTLNFETFTRHSNGAEWGRVLHFRPHTRFSYTYLLPYPYPIRIRN